MKGRKGRINGRKLRIGKERDAKLMSSKVKNHRRIVTDNEDEDDDDDNDGVLLLEF